MTDPSYAEYCCDQHRSEDKFAVLMSIEDARSSSLDAPVMAEVRPCNAMPCQLAGFGSRARHRLMRWRET